jgi:hypothetical protein
MDCLIAGHTCSLTKHEAASGQLLTRSLLAIGLHSYLLKVLLINSQLCAPGDSVTFLRIFTISESLE